MGPETEALLDYGHISVSPAGPLHARFVLD